MRLTGVATCDPSTAMLCAPLFAWRTGAWSEEASRAVEVRASALPPIVESHAVIGAVTRAAAAATGLREGTPVVAGAGDFAASALAAGVLEQGEACLTLGTAGNLTMPRVEPRFDARLVNSHHAGCARWLALGATLCGGALEWFRNTCAPGASWSTLEAEAAAVPLGAEGVVALPYLQGERTPIWDDGARGAFAGLGLSHGRGHMYRALLEGIALGFRACLAVAEETGVRLDEAIAVEGGGGSHALRQACADAMGVPVVWIRGAGSSVAGAALLAGVGAGVLHDVRAARAWRTDLEGRSGPSDVARHIPDPRARDHFQRAQARQATLYAATRS
jgi:xylulokinase